MEHGTHMDINRAEWPEYAPLRQRLAELEQSLHWVEDLVRVAAADQSLGWQGIRSRERVDPWQERLLLPPPPEKARLEDYNPHSWQHRAVHGLLSRPTLLRTLPWVGLKPRGPLAAELIERTAIVALQEPLHGDERMASPTHEFTQAGPY